MNSTEFRKHAHDFVDWMADYLETVEKLPVRSREEPGTLLAKLPEHAPEQGEAMEDIFRDFQELIMPGITHWQHPAFFGYFPANNSEASILAEMLTAALGVQGMVWETSPAATELEERVMDWLREMIGLPEDFSGVIQDSASTSTLVAILTAREKKSQYRVNREGFQERRFTVYFSEEAHSSVEKGAKIAGIGADNCRSIAVDDAFAMRPAALEAAILEDKKAGFIPLCVIGACGTTGSTALDPLAAIADIAREHELWFHVDAAYAGSAAILPELRWIQAGAEKADSYVFNPHKWLFTNFDCSAFFVRDREALTKTFAIHPEYLKTGHDAVVNNYRDWGIQLGRRFRALKLWFVLRSFGREGLQTRLRHHLGLARQFRDELAGWPEIEIMAPAPLALVCFRFVPEGASEEACNHFNKALEQKVNDSGRALITHTTLRGRYTLRAVFGQTHVDRSHIKQLLALLREVYQSLQKAYTINESDDEHK